MKTTFILAKHFGVTPFDIMAQELEAVIMIVNYLVESGRESNNDNNTNNNLSEKDKDKEFWNVL